MKFLATLVVDRAAMRNKTNKEEFLKSFGANFGKLRQERNLSFRTLSQKCDLDYADLNKIEKGKRNITLSTIIELANGLDIHPRELFDFYYSSGDFKG